MRRTEGNLPTRSATLFQAVPLRIVEHGRRGSAPVPKPVDVGKQAWEEAGSEERRLGRRDDAHGCHVRTFCHVKCCFQRGVERALIGYLPRTPSRPRSIQRIWNAIVGLWRKEDAAFHKNTNKFNDVKICIYFIWTSSARADTELNEAWNVGGKRTFIQPLGGVLLMVLWIVKSKPL